MRRTLDQLLAAPGLTRGRFLALALLSLLATAVVVAAGVRHDRTPWDLVAAARSRPAPVVEVAPRRPVAQAAPAAARATESSTTDSTASQSSSDSGVAAATPSAPVSATTAPVSNAKPKTDTQPVTTPAKPVSKVKHVFVVNVAGIGYDETQSPYVTGTLVPQSRVLQGYRPLTDGDLASADALVSGQKPTPGIAQGCPTYGGDCLFPVETLTLADQFVTKGQHWRGYFGAMPAACTHPDLNAADTSSGDYVTQRNPFVYFHSLTELGECGTNDLPLDSLDADLAKPETTPNFTYVAPASCSDPTCADTFLSQLVPKILAAPAYKADGLLIVVFGAAADGTSRALLVSQFAQPGTTSQTQYDPYSMLRSIEDLFGLDYLGSAGDPKVASFANSELSAGV